MNDTHQDPNDLLDRASSQIRDSQPDPQVAEEAAARVWARLVGDGAQAAAHAAAVTEIRGCDDYQALIPAYLAGSLPEARRLLLEDHSRACIPCRKALKAARSGKPATAAPAITSRRATTSLPWRRWALAAALLAGLGLVPLLLWQLMPLGSGDSAVVASADGDLFRVSPTAHVSLAEGEVIREGDSVRTGRTGGAVLRLEDGSRVEMRERSELAIDESRRGTTIELARGSVIVEAAPQRNRHLYVATEDCLVSVTGTVFSVNHGTKGSRVSVIEGEVRVDHAGDEAILHPGQQIATHASLGTVPVEDEIAWSRNVDHYIQMMRELNALRHQLAAEVPRPELRYESRLLDLLPADTVFVGAVPNLSDSITETHRIIRERIATSPTLQQWWQETGAEESFGPQIDRFITTVGDLGTYLGSEMLASGQLSGDDEMGGPLVLAEVVDAAGLRAFIEEQLATHGDGQENVVFVDDPASASPVVTDSLYIWLTPDLFVASPRLPRLQEVAVLVASGGVSAFTATDFYAQIAALYADGVGVVVAADLEAVLGQALAEDDTGPDAAQLAQTGFDSVRHLLIEQKRITDTAYHSAVLSFRGERGGVASWLAEPAPMGSLDFVSPDARFFTSFVFKDPKALLDDVYGMLRFGGNDVGAELRAFEEEIGLSLREDFAAVLGGEVTFALDGPMLPEPSWKLVMDVYDAARFQWTIERTIEAANVHLAAEGEGPLSLREEQVGRHTYYAIEGIPAAVHYTFSEGYFVAGPNRAILDQALRFRDSGYTIADASRFTSLLPTDGRVNFSGLFYQDLGGLLGELAGRLASGQLSEAQRQALEEIQADSTPTLAYAYGERDRITLAAASDGDLFSSGLFGLLGLGESLKMGDLLARMGGEI